MFLQVRIDLLTGISTRIYKNVTCIDMRFKVSIDVNMWEQCQHVEYAYVHL